MFHVPKEGRKFWARWLPAQRCRQDVSTACSTAYRCSGCPRVCLPLSPLVSSLSPLGGLLGTPLFSWAAAWVPPRALLAVPGRLPGRVWWPLGCSRQVVGRKSIYSQTARANICMFILLGSSWRSVDGSKASWAAFRGSWTALGLPGSLPPCWHSNAVLGLPASHAAPIYPASLFWNS